MDREEALKARFNAPILIMGIASMKDRKCAPIDREMNRPAPAGLVLWHCIDPRALPQAAYESAPLALNRHPPPRLGFSHGRDARQTRLTQARLQGVLHLRGHERV